jgi:hypothetical protein
MKKQHHNHNNMRKPKSVFLVSASKSYGEPHSYIVGVYSTLGLAVDSSYLEEDSRGGKYSCSITEIVLNDSVSPSYVSYRMV